MNNSCYIFVLQIYFLISGVALAQNEDILCPLIHNKKIEETIETRFHPPNGYKRIQAENGTFAHYLRNLLLLPDDSPVKDYRGFITNSKKDVTVASVVDYPIRGKKLEQYNNILNSYSVPGNSWFTTADSWCNFDVFYNYIFHFFLFLCFYLTIFIKFTK